MPDRPSRPAIKLTVTASREVTPNLIRVEFTADDLSAFAESGFTDRYVKLRLTDRNGDPAVRTYTALDPFVHETGAGTLAIEFVVHGDEGVAGPWAAAAQPGDVLEVNGPGGAYTPDPTADWHLFAGDESALPAIGAALAALPADATVAAYVEVEGPDHEVDLPAVTWVHRSSGGSLLDAVRGQEWLPGRVDCFVHGEAETVMHGIRPYLLTERGLPRREVSISGYWRRGRSEEGFRQWKADLRASEEG